MKLTAKSLWAHAVTVNRLHRRRFARFVAVGLLNTIFGYTFYLAGLWLALSPIVALALATAIGAVFNHFTIGRIVFGSTSFNSLPRFVVSYGAVFLVNAVLLNVLVALGVRSWLGQALVLPLVVLANFAVMNGWVFRAQRRE